MVETELSRRINSKTNGVQVEDIPIGDERWLRRTYGEFNRIFFQGELTGNLMFEWCNRMKVTAGSCHYSRDRVRGRVPELIKISAPFMRKNPSEIYEVLIHEMIHVKHPDSGHGKDFKEEMDRLNREYGLELAMYTKNKGVRPYIYGCTQCDNEFSRARRFNLSHYTCGSCGGQLEKRGGE